MTNIERRTNYLYLEYSESYTYQNYLAISKQVAAICQAENYKKVLVNASKMVGKVKPLERFEIGVKGALIFRNRVKIAVIYRKEEIDWFAETVSVNRGLNAKIFSELHEAMKWLEVE